MIKTKRKVQFKSDKVNIRTRASDNSLIVTFETGEYEASNIAELFKFLTDTVYTVTVEFE